jgi:hypothetical protein
MNDLWPTKEDLYIEFVTFCFDRFEGIVPDEKLLRNAYKDWIAH